MLRIKKGIDYKYLLYVFFCFSIFCWFLEMLYSLVFRFKFVFPGALYGPWCPIYGVTSIILILFINKKDKKIINFIKIFLKASLIEYFASFVCDKLFHKTIWDYSDYFFNINGRICLLMSLVFTLLAFIMLYFLEPFVKKIYEKYKRKFDIISKILIIIFIIDLVTKIVVKNFY